jgi:mono/diheme cytochrome c family protein
MRLLMLVFVLSLILQAGDPDRGRLVIEDAGCLECHTVNGTGAGHESINPAADLAKRLTATYTPSSLASALWNHTPGMWSALVSKSASRVAASEQDWEDAFAYLYSLQFFELPAEVGRGKAVIDTRCANCHREGGLATPPSRWNRMDDPVALVYQMWNHAPRMADRMAEQKKLWVRLNARDFLDLTAYLQNLLRQAPNRQLLLPKPSEGKNLFSLYCAGCHTGPRAFEASLRNKTWMDIGAGMWNHAPSMLKVPAITPEDFRKILAYVWELQYEGPPGNVDQGHRTFNNKRCIACHRDAATGEARSPRIGQSFTPFSMIALSWGRGRQMHQRIEQEGMRWPSISAHEMKNLVAFLNSTSGPQSSR